MTPRMTTHCSICLFGFMVSMTTSKDLARYVDEQAEDGGDVAGNLSCAPVPRKTTVIDALNGQEPNIRGKQHCSLDEMDKNFGQETTGKSDVTHGSDGVLPVSFQYRDEPPPRVIVDRFVDKCRV